MGRKRLKPGHNPEHFDCQNPQCKRTTPLAIEHYRMPYPSADVAEEKIHRVPAGSMGGFCIMCPACAHYTVVSRIPHNAK